MTFRNCVINGQKEGLITEDQGAKALDTYQQLKMLYKESMPETSAESLAAKETFDILKYEAAHKRRVTLKQAAAWKRIKFDLDNYAGNPGKAAEALIAAHDVNANFANLEKRTATVRNLAFARMDNILGTFRRGLFGSRNKAKQKNMVREVFGDDTGDVAAKELATAWKETSSYLRVLANDLGMRIANRKDWGLPQIHHIMNIRKAGLEEWKSFIRPLLDPNKMIDELTGKPFISEVTPGGRSVDRLNGALDEVFDTIATDGANKIKDGKATLGKKSLVNRRQDHRFLVFKDADSWMKYQERFGEPDAFKTMINHVENMAKDIAELEVLGPNPSSMINAINQYVRKTTSQVTKSGDAKAWDKAKKHLANMEMFYNIHSRKNNQAIDGVFGNVMAGGRHLLQSAQLGAAPLSAITDLQTQRLTARFVGIPQVKLLGNVLKHLMPLGIEEKGRLAIRLGLGADNWVSTAIAASRYFGEVTGPETTRRIADFSMRLSGLSPLTQAGRQAFGNEFLGHMADNVTKNFDEVETIMGRIFKRYNITRSDWDIIRETPLTKEGFIDPHGIETRTDLLPGQARNTTTKLLDAILTETESAVPSSSYRARAFLTGDARPGTINGELVRSFAMYKNYAATIMHTHLMKYFHMDGSRPTKASFFADYFIGTTIMGALALQLKEMSRGKDPRPMDDEKFWGAALLQGGGLGIMGDFFYSSTSRFDGQLSETAAGPVVGLIGDTGRLMLNPEDLAKNSIKYIGRYTPGSSTWYFRLAIERLILDKLQAMANPKYRSHFRAKERNAKRHTNNKYWWRPGKDVPSRPPNISNIMGR